MFKLKLFLLLFLFISASGSLLQAQDEKASELIYIKKDIINDITFLQTETYKNRDKVFNIKVEGNGMLSTGDNAPFWFTNKNYGIGSVNKNKAYSRVGLYSNNYFADGRLRLSVGADVLAAYNYQTDLYLHQLFADIRYRSLGLSIGLKERNNPLKNEYLSSGSLALSNSARPIPQIEAGLPDFVPVPLTKDWLHIQGQISYGFFPDNDYKERHQQNGWYTRRLLYHHKYAYLKLEKPHSNWNIIAGLEMNTQWGGHIYMNNVLTHKGKVSFSEFFKVLLPQSGGSGATLSDQENIEGNVNGSWHLIFNYDKPDYAFKVYHEHFFEDKSGMRVYPNFPDGLYGVELNFKKRQPISSVLFEFLYTKDQSGPTHYANDSVRMQGGDNYYNHGGYASMTYYGYVLGNPLLVSPLYNDGQTLRLLNNRVISYHLGISGYLSDYVDYRSLITYSRAYGEPNHIPDKAREQFSVLLEANYRNPKLKGWIVTGAVAYDKSKHLVGDNFGCQLKIAKNFNIR